MIVIDIAKRDSLLAERIAARRYEAEVGGCLINGMAVATDDRSKTLIVGAALEAMAASSYSVRFKAGDGFIELTGQEIIQFASAIRSHVQACFNREDALLAELKAGTFTEAMLEEGWP